MDLRDRIAEQDQEIKAQAARIRALEAELAIAQAAGADPDDTLLTGIGGGPGETTVHLRPPEKLMRAIIASLIAKLDSAPNYVEIEAAHPAYPGRYTVTVQRAEGKSPHTLRMEAEERARTAREDGRREGMAELVAHLEDVAAEARTGRDAGYPEEAAGMGPTRWCLVTDRSHQLARRYADGKGVSVPDATARAQEVEAELRREQGRHASEVLGLKAQMAGHLIAAREEQTELLAAARRRELALVDRLRRRGEHLHTLKANTREAEPAPAAPAATDAKERTMQTPADPELYIDTIADTLRKAGAAIADCWAQKDAALNDDGDLMWEGFIGFKFDADDPDEHPDEVGFAWNQRDGWQHLTGPRTDFGPFNNIRDMGLAVDAPVNEVVSAILTALGVDDPAGTVPLLL
ncbi:hypothetical protein [Nocardiopsis sp. FR26]|uniref:hypothetical protein n=1 Tax=Nocardiopsis sp. FR26 TaxID=2605987 RepID=UPI0013597045|nr:hypothetical protein [Nocardiopsis sp. FR26]